MKDMTQAAGISGKTNHSVYSGRKLQEIKNVHDAILRYAFAVTEFFSPLLEFWLFGAVNIRIAVFISPL